MFMFHLWATLLMWFLTWFENESWGSSNNQIFVDKQAMSLTGSLARILGILYKMKLVLNSFCNTIELLLFRLQMFHWWSSSGKKHQRSVCRWSIVCYLLSGCILLHFAMKTKKKNQPLRTLNNGINPANCIYLIKLIDWLNYQRPRFCKLLLEREVGAPKQWGEGLKDEIRLLTHFKLNPVCSEDKGRLSLPLGHTALLLYN